MRDDEASTTARRVAAQRLAFRRVPAPYGDPDADTRLQARMAGSLAGAAGRPGGPMSRYLQARTTFVDRAVVTALDQGVTQVVSVGAGYDGRALRYARDGVRWFELDHPATQADKRAILAELGIDAPATSYVPADFARDDVAAGLRAAGLDPARPALLTCEGVAGYLDLPVLAGLLAALAAAAGPGSTLAVTLSLRPGTRAGRARRRRLAGAVAAMGEPLRSSLPLAELDPFLAAAGWRVLRATDPAGTPLAAGGGTSAFVVAERC
ncbi:MAG TPA: SAM-dependent methyltransferase [Acidimicrobiales bacterium]|nr:SAM-dependent methyltransferase [Acidimicrobiales bacterium]